MKQTKMIALVALFASGVSACNKAPQSDEAEVADAQEVSTPAVVDVKMTVDTAASQVTFVGSKPTGKHYGTFDITDGTLEVKNNQVVGGKYTIDLSSLNITDEGMAAEDKMKLTGHLKSGDFFEVEKNPTATFEIVKIAPYTAKPAASGNTAEESEDNEFMIADPTHTVTGNLTIKGTTKSLTFPAKITLSGDQVTAAAKFNIDRTTWGMNYRSESSLGDKIIYPTVNIGFDVVAKK